MRRWFNVLGIAFDRERGIGFWIVADRNRDCRWFVHYFPPDDLSGLPVQNREVY